MSVLCFLLLFGVVDGPALTAPSVAPSSVSFAATAAATADQPREKEGAQVLAKYLQITRNQILRGVSMVAHFAGRLPKMKMTATVDARRRIAGNGAIEYEVSSRTGDNTVWKEIILRYINGEMENAGKDNSRVAVTPANYKFKYKGERERDGRLASVYEVTPRKKREGLFRGEIWVDVDTALPVLESGRLVKSPSVFLKKVQFTREYAVQDGVPVPKALQTSIETRFWGTAELDIQYSELQWEPSAAAQNPSE